jgi:hypothetical protein
MDITLAILPWITVRKLQMKTAEKLGVAIAMSMGVLYVTISCLKTLTDMLLTDASLQRRNHCSGKDCHHSLSRYWRLYL